MKKQWKSLLQNLVDHKQNEIGNYCVAGHNNRDGTMFGEKLAIWKIGDTIKS